MGERRLIARRVPRIAGRVAIVERALSAIADAAFGEIARAPRVEREPARGAIVLRGVERSGTESEGAVALASCGALAVLALVSVESRATREELVPAAAPARSTAPAGPTDPIDGGAARDPRASIAGWSARELRALPGLGEKRAVAIVRARWEGVVDGTVGSLDRVPGIGEGTVETLEEELALRRARATPPARALPTVDEITRTDATSAEEDE